MIRTQISLTQEQYDALQVLAERRSESMAAVIRDAVDRLLALSKQTPVEAWLEIAGTASSGLGDLSENHDEYIDGPDGEA